MHRTSEYFGLRNRKDSECDCGKRVIIGLAYCKKCYKKRKKKNDKIFDLSKVKGIEKFRKKNRKALKEVLKTNRNEYSKALTRSDPD